MKKTIFLLGWLAILSPAVFADWGMMDGYEMGIYKIIYFALAAFLFSVIFWMTHNWIVPKKKK